MRKYNNFWIFLKKISITKCTKDRSQKWPHFYQDPYYFPYTKFYVNLIGRPPTYRIFLFFRSVLHDIIRWTIQKGSTLVHISQKFTTGRENSQTFIFDSYKIDIKSWPKPLLFSLYKLSYYWTCFGKINEVIVIMNILSLITCWGGFLVWEKDATMIKSDKLKKIRINLLTYFLLKKSKIMTQISYFPLSVPYKNRYDWISTHTCSYVGLYYEEMNSTVRKYILKQTFSAQV